MPVVFSVLGFLTFLILSPTRQPAETVSLPGGSGGIGFDDLQFSRSLDLVLVPGGRTGNLDLVHPRTASVTSISGFSTSTGYKGGHGEGITSVSEGEGKLYVTDRSSRALCVVDATTRKIVARTTPAAARARQSFSTSYTTERFSEMLRPERAWTSSTTTRRFITSTSPAVEAPPSRFSALARAAFSRSSPGCPPRQKGIVSSRTRRA